VILDITLSSDSSTSLHLQQPPCRDCAIAVQICSVTDYLNCISLIAADFFFQPPIPHPLRPPTTQISGKSLSRPSRYPPGSSSPSITPTVTFCAPILAPWWRTPGKKASPAPLANLHSCRSCDTKSLRLLLSQPTPTPNGRDSRGERDRPCEQSDLIPSPWSPLQSPP
jgi:hypothetical protein